MPETTIQALEAKAEAKRREAQSQQVKEPTISSEPVATEHVETQCRECGETYLQPRLYIGDQEVPVFAGLCGACVARERASEAVTNEQPRDVLREMESLGINLRRHGRCTLESFDATAGDKPLEATRAFIEDTATASRWDPVRGLYLCGPTGTGKTHLAVAVVRRLLERGTMQVVFDRASRLMTEIQDTYGTGRTGAVLERRERAELWILDDLGTEKATDDTLRILHDLLNAREAHPNVITSNVPPNELGKRWRDQDGWARISSRLARANFRAVKVEGGDRRFAA